jgi:heme exporter protein B
VTVSSDSARKRQGADRRASDSENARVFVRQALAVCGKDLRVEVRDRVAINSVLLFAVAALTVVAFSPGAADLRPVVKAALLWIVLFFAAFSGLAHVFLTEEEAQTAIPLRLAAQAGAVFAGKLLFNLALLAVMGTVVAPLYVVLLEVRVASWPLFAATLIAGGWALGAAATIVGAIVAKARGKGALYGALGLPIVLPLLLVAVQATSLALAGGAETEDVRQALVGLVSYAVMLTTAAGLVMPVVWDQP